MQVSEHFSHKELACKCCGVLNLEEHFLYELEKIRNEYGKPIIVNCCFRCEKHNEEVGGTKNSFHIQGMAIDIKNPDSSIDKRKLIEIFMNNGWTIGIYKTFIHADRRKNRTIFWGNH